MLSFVGGYADVKSRHPAYNIVSCDGHIEAVKRGKLLEKSEQWARRWFIDNQPHQELWMAFDGP